MLVLKTLKYAERLGHPKEWTVDELTLGPTNLIVGVNATGKTRTLNTIANLAKMFVPGQMFRPMNCGYDLQFEGDGAHVHYELTIENGSVTNEQLAINDDKRIQRRGGNSGKIYLQDDQRTVRFKPPPNEIAVVSRRDLLQHPYLEPLHEWAMAVRHYMFGDSLGKNMFASFGKGGQTVDDRDANQVVGIFRKAEKELGQVFVDAVIHDMAKLGYFLDRIAIAPTENVQLVEMPEGREVELHSLSVSEKGISGPIDNLEISQGMFRVLSIIIQVNYSQLSRRANCILIDDIGEGLDFDRSTHLIDLLRKKARESSFQLVMTTNDRFVMNSVPLEEWTVLKRDGNHVCVFNHENSRDLFEEFKFTGLSNFSFLEMDFTGGHKETETAVHE